MMPQLAFVLVFVLGSCCLPGQSYAAVSIPIDEFETHAEGELETWVDRRDLLVMHHPWVPSTTGGYCQATATVTLSPDSSPPFRLAIYQNDNYFNDFWRAKNDSWLGGDGFFGHRFKQVWVDGQLLWESDVADANAPQVPGLLELDLPDEVVKDNELLVSLKVVDKVSSWIELASDTQHISTTEVAAEKPEDPAKFWTNVYWGDIQVLSGAEDARAGEPPARKKLRNHQQLQSKTSNPSEDSDVREIPLRLSCSVNLPEGGYPLRCGIPLPRNWEGEPRHLRISKESKWTSYAYFEDFAKTIDGHRRWVAIESIAMPGMEDSEVWVNDWREPYDASSIFSTPTAPPNNIHFFPGNSSAFKTCKAGTHLYFASCEIRFDPDHTEEMIELPFLTIQTKADAVRLGYSDRTETISIEKERVIVPPPSWLVIDLGEEHHFCSLRWIEGVESTRFQIEEDDAGIHVTLLPYFLDGQAKPYPATTGEAKTFEILYCLFEGKDPEEDYPKLAGNFNHPPLLINTEVLGQTQVWGEGLPPTEGIGEELQTFLDTHTPDPLGASFNWGKNLRDFGDIIYSSTNSWRNGYYDVRQGFAAAYLISGSREWADALDRTVRHYLDVDMIHWNDDRPEFVGLPHGYGDNHTTMDPWNPITRANGVFAAAHVWANTEYYRDALQMARQVAKTGRAIGAGSVRDHAGVMMTLATAYRETGDTLFTSAGKKLIEDIANNRVDLRRGTYPEVHGNWNYRGNVPWMVAQLMEPLYIYYRETGDLQAASLMVGMADSILAENQTRGVPGDIHGYSHNPHFRKNSGYHVLIAPCLFYAYDLTGDETFKEAAIAAWEQTVREGTINSVLNCFWNTPALVHYLRHLDTAE